MKAFTYILLQILTSIAFLVVAALSTGQNPFIRIGLGIAGILLLLVSFKIMHDAIGDQSVTDLMSKPHGK